MPLDSLVRETNEDATESTNSNGGLNEATAVQIAQQAADLAAKQAVSDVVGSLPGKKRGRPAGSANQYVPKAGLSRLFPGSGEYLVVRKRNENGKTVFIGNYSNSDLQGCLNIESFLQKYIIPKWQYGEYAVSLASNTGTENHTEFYNIIAPPETTPLGTPATQQNTLKGLFSELATNPNLSGLQIPTASSPADRLERIERLLEHKEDPKDLLIKRLLDQVDKPAVQPMQQSQTGEIIAAMAKMVEAIKPAPTPAVQQGPTLQELLLLIQQMQPKQQDPIDVLAKFASMKREMTGDLASAVEKIAQKLDSPPPDPLDNVQQVLTMSQMIKQMASEQTDGIAGTIGTLFKGLPQVSQLIDKQRGLVEAQNKAKASETAESTIKPSHQPQKKQLAPLPEGFDTYLTALQTAKEPREQIKSTLLAFEFLGKHPYWDKYYSAMFRLAQDGDNNAVKYIDALLSNFVARGLIEKNRQLDIVKVFGDNWPTIAANAFGFEPESAVGDESDGEQENQPPPV